jgi:hypothetical protein
VDIGSGDADVVRWSRSLVVLKQLRAGVEGKKERREELIDTCPGRIEV